MGPDGKTPHSWRVELLPFFDAKYQELAKQYKKDEPWDSPNNLKVMEAGAEMLQRSHRGSRTRIAAISCWSVRARRSIRPMRPPSIRKIRDGTSKTIGLVEAKRAIPWTKPEDIAYDPGPAAAQVRRVLQRRL